MKTSLHDLLFQDVQARYLNISFGNIRSSEFIDSCLDEGSFLEVDVKDLIFKNVSFRYGEVFKTSLQGIDLKTVDIEGLQVDLPSLKGAHVDIYQAASLARLLGVIVE